MKNKTYWFSVIASFIAMGVVAFGTTMLAGSQMQSMMALGRPEAEMMSLIWVQMLGYFVITCVFVYIYSKGRESGSWQEGVRYGAIIGVLMCGVSMWSYSVYPWELQTLYADMIINIVVYTVGGIVTALIYKPA